jgi:phosphatidate cytidylyltransferase
MLRRIATALILIPLVTALVWWGDSAIVAGVLAIILLLALQEFFSLSSRVSLPGFVAFRGWTSACAVLLLFSQWSEGKFEISPLNYGVEIIRNRVFWSMPLDLCFVIFAFGCVVIALGSRIALAEILQIAGLSAAGLLLIVLPASFLVRLDQVPLMGPRWVLFVLVLVWAGDIAAYFTGQAVGRTALAPLLSPQKTWEGAAGNVAASLLVGYLFADWLSAPTLQIVVLAGVAGIAGQCGDLMESAYKRGAHMKDSGTLLPGHGGMLDRIDSLIFATPVVWYYVDWLLRTRG